MATINITTKDILKVAKEAVISIKPRADYLVSGTTLIPGANRLVFTDSNGTAVVNLYAGDYTGSIESKSFLFTVPAGEGTHNLIDLLQIENQNYNAQWVTLFNSFNVKDYGAKGDNTTDDTTSIQSALTACTNAGGGTVLLPKGTYIVNPNIGLTIGSNTIVRGDGSATIKVKNATNLDGNLLKVENRTNVKIHNLTLDGNKSGQTAGTNYGLYISASKLSFVENVRAYNFSGVGIQIYNCDDCTVISSISENNGYHGFEIEQCRDVVVTGNISFSNARHGFYLAPGEISGTGSKYCIISNNIARNNLQYGISVGISVIGSIYLTQACEISGNQIYENSHYGISLYRQDQQIVTNNIIRNNGYSGIYLYQSGLNKIESNFLQNNSAALNAGYDEIQIEGGSDGVGSQNNTINYNTIVTNGTNKARYAIREAHSLDSNNVIAYNTIFDTPATGLFLVNSKVLELKSGKLQSSGIMQTNSGSGSAVDTGYFGIDGEFGIARLVNNKGNVNTQYVNVGSGQQQFWVNGNQRMTIKTNTINIANLPTTATGLSAGDLWNSAGTLRIV